MSFEYTPFEKKKVFVGFSLGRHFQSRRRLSCPCLLKNPYICAECGFSQILALKIKPVIAAKAKKKQIEAGGAVRQKSDKAVVDTKKELAKLAGVSHDTIAKVEKLVDNATPEIKQALRADSKHMETQGVYMDF